MAEEKKKTAEVTTSPVLEPVKPAEKKYCKDAIVSSKKYAADRDVLAAILNPDKQYSDSDIKRELESFKRGSVK